MNAETNIWYLFITSGGTPINQIARIRFSSEKYIYDLKQKIKETHSKQLHKLKGIRAEDLFVWRYQQGTLLSRKRGKTFIDSVRMIFSNNEATELGTMDKLSDLTETDLLFIEVPQMPGLHYELGESLGNDKEFIEKFIHTFIRIPSHGYFQMDYVAENGIQEWLNPNTLPSYVVEILTKLDEEPVTSDVPSTMQDKALPSVSKSLHISREQGNKIRYHEDSMEAALISKIFFPLAEYINMHDPYQRKFKCNFSTNQWFFDLVIFVNEIAKGFRKSFRSGASWWKHNFPSLLADIFSQGKDDDHARLCLQGGSVVRLANILLHHEDKAMEFVLLLIYVDQNFTVHRYVLFQDGKPLTSNPAPVYYTCKQYYLREEAQRIKLLHELYNYADWLLNSHNDSKIPANLPNRFKTYIQNEYFKCPATSKSGTKRKREEHEDDQNNDDGRHGSNGAPAEHLNAAGFQPALANTFETCKLARGIYRVREEKSGKVCIAKRVRPGSDEAEILQQLNAVHPPCNHIIDLLSVIDTKSDMGKWIVLPQQRVLTELRTCVFFGLLPRQFVQLSRDLAKGVSFLHDNGIAHRDIKLANLVFTQNHRLQIIDFDTSVRVSNEDEKVGGYVGTKGYMAPEIGPEMGPQSYYSPIRADRYSCGIVLKEFLELHKGDDEGLLDFANKLTSSIPYERPPLSKWCNVVADEAEDAFGIFG